MCKYLSFLKKNKYILLIIIVYFMFFIQMQSVYFYGDDYQVLYPLHLNRNFFDVLNFCIEKMQWFWMNWSGRITGHFIVSFGLSFYGIQFIRILNPVMLFLMVLLLVKILNLFIKIDIKKWIFWISFIFLGTNIFISREVLYWSYASILYIWGFVLTLLIIYFALKKFYLDKNIPLYQEFIFSILIIIQSFILEQLSIILILILILLNILILKKNKKLNFKFFILLLISIIGFIISAVAPGNILRTEPLVSELVNVPYVYIILGKIYCFLNTLFNNQLFGMYFITFGLIVSYVYKKKINNHKILNMIPIVFIYSLTVIIFFERVFKLNILGGYTNLDALYTFYYETNSIFILIVQILYYLVILGSIIYMFLKTIDNHLKLLAWILAICFISTFLPTIFIRYTGTRYYLFLLSITIIISIYYIVKEKAKMFDTKMLVFILVLIPNVVFMYILFGIYICNFFCDDRFNKFINKFSLHISILVLSIYFSFNFLSTILGYYKNSSIHEDNFSIMKNRGSDEIVFIQEIPYNMSLYGWHTIYTNYSDITQSYYGFYLNDFYSDFFNFDVSKVLVLSNDN